MKEAYLLCSASETLLLTFFIPFSRRDTLCPSSTPNSTCIADVCQCPENNVPRIAECLGNGSVCFKYYYLTIAVQRCIPKDTIPEHVSG